MAFKDTHAAVFAEGYEGDAAGELLASYDEDSGLAAAALAEAAIASEAQAAQLLAAAAEIQRLKAKNYELLENVQATDTAVDPDPDEDPGEDDESDPDNPESVEAALEAHKIDED